MQEVFVVVTEEFQTLIHLTLRRLIEEKSKRDKVKFTACQLAQALGMPRSMITKLTHFDKTKRVINPRIDTLIKIVDFFRSDGFNISLEALIGSERKQIDINSQPLAIKNSLVTIPIYLMDNKKDKKLGVVNLKTNREGKDIFGLHFPKDIKPFFKAGSIFIIDPYMPLKNGSLIAIRLPRSKHIEIKKYCVQENKILLKSLDEMDEDIILMPTSQPEIVGVVIQVNAKT